MKAPRNYLLKLTGIAIAICLFTGPILLLVAHPTEQHLATSRYIEQTSYDTLAKGKDFTEVYESEEYKSYSESPEYNYSTAVQFASTILSFLTLITLPGWVYFRLRRNRAAKNAIGATFLIVAVPYILIDIIGTYILTKLLMQSPSLDATLEIFSVAMSIAITLVVFTIVLMLWQSYYEKHRNFVVE